MIPNTARRQMTNAVMTGATAACAFFTVFILFIVLGYIAWRGLSSINIQFLIDTPKPVGEGGGISNAIVGTLLLLLLACVMGLPIGIASGVYLAEFGGNWFGKAVRFATDTLTGVPSIVAGIFAYVVIVLPTGHFSAYSGGVALALIMIPIVTRTTEEMIHLVPHNLREGALALGAPHWRVTTGIVLPAAATGIATGAMLAVARVSGETAPLIFTAFGYRFLSFRLDRPIASLTQQIFNYAISPYDDWHAKAWAATLILMATILTINIVVRFVTRKRF
jgi:phosphate transport system permease protein